MVWRKVIVCALLLFALVVPLAPRANAASAQLDMDAFMQAQEFAKSLVSLSDDYLFVVLGERDFILYVGDIEFANFTYTGDVSSFRLTYIDDGSSPFVASSYHVSLNYVANGFFFSNIGGAVDFMPKEVYISYAILFVLCIAFCCYLLRSIFGFCLRRRS